jgi:hypothetical protein
MNNFNFQKSNSGASTTPYNKSFLSPAQCWEDIKYVCSINGAFIKSDHTVDLDLFSKLKYVSQDLAKICAYIRKSRNDGIDLFELKALGADGIEDRFSKIEREMDAKKSTSHLSDEEWANDILRRTGRKPMDYLPGETTDQFAKRWENSAI